MASHEEVYRVNGSQFAERIRCVEGLVPSVPDPARRTERLFSVLSEKPVPRTPKDVVCIADFTPREGVRKR